MELSVKYVLPSLCCHKLGGAKVQTIFEPAKCFGRKIKKSGKCLEKGKKFLSLQCQTPKEVMETIKKRTREEVRAAFRAYMREKEEERKAAQIRLEAYHQKRLAGLI